MNELSLLLRKHAGRGTRVAQAITSLLSRARPGTTKTLPAPKARARSGNEVSATIRDIEASPSDILKRVTETHYPRAQKGAYRKSFQDGVGTAASKPKSDFVRLRNRTPGQSRKPAKSSNTPPIQNPSTAAYDPVSARWVDGRHPGLSQHVGGPGTTARVADIRNARVQGRSRPRPEEVGTSITSVVGDSPLQRLAARLDAAKPAAGSRPANVSINSGSFTPTESLGTAAVGPMPAHLTGTRFHNAETVASSSESLKLLERLRAQAQAKAPIPSAAEARAQARATSSGDFKAAPSAAEARAQPKATAYGDFKAAPSAAPEPAARGLGLGGLLAAGAAGGVGGAGTFALGSAMMAPRPPAPALPPIMQPPKSRYHGYTPY